MLLTPSSSLWLRARPFGASKQNIRLIGTQQKPTSRNPQSRNPQSRNPQSRNPQSRDPQFGNPQSRYPQSRDPQSRDPQFGNPQSRYPQSRGPQSRGPQSRNSQSRYPQSRDPQFGHPQFGNPQSRYPQSDNPQSHNPQSHNPQSHNPQSHNPQPLNTLPDWNKEADFFSFKGGRFIQNEERELAKRYIKFDIEELARRAAVAVQGEAGLHTRVKIQKLKDGLNSKLLLFTLDDGTELVGKVPYPSFGTPHFTTASEVATMKFMRDVMKTPVPKVVAHSSSSDNPIGAEYIIMEKKKGVRLSERWGKLTLAQRQAFVSTLSQYMVDWTNTSFPMFGGLYFKRDLDQAAGSLTFTDKNSEEVTLDDYAMGPSNNKLNYEYGRSKAEFDKGPWSSAVEYEVATARREKSCVEQLEPPPSPYALYTSFTYLPSKEKKIRAAECHARLAKIFMADEPELNGARIWHDDLNPDNILVDPSYPSIILGILDWRFAELAPFYMRKLEPDFLETNGLFKPLLLTRPREREILKTFKPHRRGEEGRQQMEAFIMRERVAYEFRRWMRDNNELFFKALGFQHDRRYDFSPMARNLFVDNESYYLSYLRTQNRRDWRNAKEFGPGEFDFRRYPFLLSSKKEKVIKDETNLASKALQYMWNIKERVGWQFVQDSRFVRHEHYDWVKSALREEKATFIQRNRKYAHLKEELDAVWPSD